VKGRGVRMGSVIMGGGGGHACKHWEQQVVGAHGGSSNIRGVGPTCLYGPLASEVRARFGRGLHVCARWAQRLVRGVRACRWAPGVLLLPAAHSSCRVEMLLAVCRAKQQAPSNHPAHNVCGHGWPCGCEAARTGCLAGRVPRLHGPCGPQYPALQAWL
jgi:hypothetical protein